MNAHTILDRTIVDTATMIVVVVTTIIVAATTTATATGIMIGGTMIADMMIGATTTDATMIGGRKDFNLSFLVANLN